MKHDDSTAGINALMNERFIYCSSSMVIII